MFLVEQAERLYCRQVLKIRKEFPELNPLAASLLIGTSLYYVRKHQSKIEGYSLPKKGPAIVTGNHQATADNYKICIAGVKSNRLIRAVVKKGLVEKGIRESDEYLKTIEDETPSSEYSALKAYVLKGEGAIPVNREKPDRKLLEETDTVIEYGGILGIFFQPHRYKDSILRNLQVGAATIARRHPDVPIYPCAFSGFPSGEDKITILKPFTYAQKAEELGRKIRVGELTIMIADSIAEFLPAAVQKDWKTRRQSELTRLTKLQTRSSKQ